jgi:cytochrome c oxidase subunit IV
MSSQTQMRPEGQQVSGWAVGGIVFAATMMVMIGVFQALAGLVAIFNDDFYVVAQNYTFDLDVSAWGWIHLLVGIAVLATGFGLFGRRTWAGVTAIMLCMLSALVNFFFIPYYPIWSLLVIGLDIWVIWSLTRPGAIET